MLVSGERVLSRGGSGASVWRCEAWHDHTEDPHASAPSSPSIATHLCVVPVPPRAGYVASIVSGSLGPAELALQTLEVGLPAAEWRGQALAQAV